MKKEETVTTKRGTKTARRGKKVKDLHAKATTARQAGRVKGGSPTFEVKDFSFGVEKSPGAVNGPSPYRFTGPRYL